MTEHMRVTVPVTLNVKMPITADFVTCLIALRDTDYVEMHAAMVVTGALKPLCGAPEADPALSVSDGMAYGMPWPPPARWQDHRRCQKCYAITGEPRIDRKHWPRDKQMNERVSGGKAT